MPAGNFPDLERFLRGVRRRLMLLRLIERVGVAVAISCAMALPLILLLAWRGAGSMSPTLLCIALGAFGGIGWAGANIPSPLEAALEADRQLKWGDLLGSAWLLRAMPDDPWRRVVLIDADRRCRGLPLSAIFLRRLTPAAWSGIALALTFTLAVSAWLGSPADSLAREPRPSAEASSAQPQDLGQQPVLAPIPLANARLSAAPPEGQDPASDGGSVSAPDGDDQNAQAVRAGSSGKDAAPSDGQGGTLGRSKPKSPAAQDAHAAATPGSIPAANGRPAGGNALSVGDVRAGAGSVAGTVTFSGRRGPINVPWTTSDWPREAEAAQRAIAAGTVPPPFRDLIRDYFQRD